MQMLSVADAIAGGYKSASRTVVAQIQSIIKARRCAANFSDASEAFHIWSSEAIHLQ